ncbi:MAG TPA: substrate-binding domain-containing protein [Capsulimonadaceae bacterium]|jgi:GntR family transcriptional regulator of arabinose operon
MIRSSKHHSVRRSLEDAIRKGEFGPGDQVPSEVELAQRCGVSYMTARKAVAELVAADVLERRASKGTFVRQAVRTRLATTTLNLVVTAYEGSNTKELLLGGVQLAKKKGWNSNIIRLTAEQQDPAVRVIRNGELAILMVDEIPSGSSLWLAMRAAKGKAISFHQNVAPSGIPTVLSESKRDLKLAADHLRSHGHTNIAHVTQVLPEGNVSWMRAAEKAAATQAQPIPILAVPTPLFVSPMKSCYETILAHVKSHPETTAFVTKSDELAMATLAACRDAGCPVPEYKSVVSLGNWHTLEYTYPPVTCVDFNFADQFEQASQIFELALAGRDLEPFLRVVDGFLVERGSVGPCLL